MKRRWFIGVLIIFVLDGNSFLQAQESMSTPLTLQEATRSTLEKNPELKAMEEDNHAAKAKVPQVRSWNDTQIGVRFYQVPFGEGLGHAMDIDYIVAQKFPFPGKKKAAAQMAYHEYLHHLELLDARGREILRDLKKTYYNLYAVQRQIAVSEKIESLLKKMSKTSQAKLATNQTSSLDAVQSQSELAKVLSEKENLKQVQSGLRAKLNQILARDIDSPVKVSSQLPLPHWNMSLENSLELALVQQPKLKIAEHQIEGKKWGIKAAKREYLPDLDAQVEYVQRPSDSPNASLGNAWTGQLMLTVPVMFKKKMKGVEQAEAELASAHYNYTATKNEVGFRVKETYTRLQSTLKVLELNQKTLLPQAEQSLQISLAAYEAGKADFLPVLLSARNLFEIQSAYWKNFENYTAAYSELEEVLGATQEELSEKKVDTSEKINQKSGGQS